MFVALLALVGCGTPSNFDGQEKVAFARECTSLIERNLGSATPPIRQLGGATLNLDDPASLYAELERLRGPQTFSFDQSKSADRSPKDQLDIPCSPQPTRSISSATTTTTTTAPR